MIIIAVLIDTAIHDIHFLVLLGPLASIADERLWDPLRVKEAHER